MSEKYLNVDIDDPRASDIAEVMSNKTAKKILSLIAEKEASESDIASELKIPLNTVGYNVGKLLRAGFIEKSKKYFWSMKGKKIPTYKLSNKKILISPKSVFGGVLPAIIVSFMGAIAIRFYYLKSAAGENAGSSADILVQKTGGTASIAAESASNTLDSIHQVSAATGYSWIWFLLGALVAILFVLIFNWRRIK